MARRAAGGVVAGHGAARRASVRPNASTAIGGRSHEPASTSMTSSRGQKAKRDGRLSVTESVRNASAPSTVTRPGIGRRPSRETARRHA